MVKKRATKKPIPEFLLGIFYDRGQQARFSASAFFSFLQPPHAKTPTHYRTTSRNPFDFFIGIS